MLFLKEFIPAPVLFGAAEVLVGFSLIAPLFAKMIPAINDKFLKLSSKDQNLFLRKCVSIVHCFGITGTVFYLQFHPELCSTAWTTFSQFWTGYLWTDLILSFLTGTSSADDRNHHILYGAVHMCLWKSGGACMASKVLYLRYYADMFNQNMQGRLILAMFGYKDTQLYRVNSAIATVGFFMVRILVIPFAWYDFWLRQNEVYNFVGGKLFYGTIVMLILSDLQNIDWSRRLYSSTVRAFQKAKKQ